MCVPTNGELYPSDTACSGDIVILPNDVLQLNSILGNEMPVSYTHLLNTVANKKNIGWLKEWALTITILGAMIITALV